MNYNTLCLQLSSCLHSSTLTSSLLPPSFTFLSASLLHASLLPCLFSLFGFLCNPFSTSLLLEPSLFLFSAFYSDYPFRYISLLFIPSLLFLLLFTPCVLAPSPPLPPSLLHLISGTLTWLSPLLPREAGEPLFPLIPANAICKH